MQSKKYVTELYSDGTAKNSDGWILGISNVSHTVLSILHI